MTALRSPLSLARSAGLALGLVMLCFVLGRAIARDQLVLAAAAAALPALVVIFSRLANASRVTLVYAAIALTLWPGGIGGREVTLSGIVVSVPDILVLLALSSWLTGVLVRPADEPIPRFRTPILGIPVLLLGIGIVQGLVRGHDQYGASLIGQPLRIALYAAIALAMTDLTADRALRAMTVILYVGTVWQTMLGLFFIATGRSQSDALYLSSGGTRILALSTAMYLAGALVLALLNAERERRTGPRLLHLAVGVCALFGVVVSYGRVTFLALSIVLFVLYVGRRRLRVAVATFLPILVPALIFAVITVHMVAPNLESTLVSRITSPVASDTSYKWRQGAVSAALAGVSDEPLQGVGFGRTTSFSTQEGRNVVRISSDPHNSYLSLLAGGGLIALGSYLLIIAISGFESWRRFRSARSQSERMLIVWAAATLFIFLVNMLAEPVLTDARLVLTIWILLLMPAVVPLRPKAQAEEVEQAPSRPGLALGPAQGSVGAGPSPARAR